MTRIGMAWTVQKIMEKNFGHILSRKLDGRLLKQVVFGIMEGSIKRGRPRKRWTDDVEE